jgi:protein Tex
VTVEARGALDESQMENVIAIDLAPIAKDLNLPLHKVQRALELLDEGNTVPFITRYRKDQTGAMEDEQIRQLQSQVARLRGLAERKQTILKSIEAQGKLTESLARDIAQATTTKRLEDLYLPYKPKKQTLATQARQRGLEPLALALIDGEIPADQWEARVASHVREEGEPQSAAEVIQGVRHLLAEYFSERVELRDRLRKLIRQTGKLVVTKLEPQPNRPETEAATPAGSSPPPDQTPAGLEERSPQDSTADSPEDSTEEVQEVSPEESANEPRGESEEEPRDESKEESNGASPEESAEEPSAEVPSGPHGEQPAEQTTEPITEPLAEKPAEQSAQVELPAEPPRDKVPETQKQGGNDNDNSNNKGNNRGNDKRNSSKNSKKQKKRQKLESAFKDYFRFSESLTRLPPHRVLAINRGERARILRVKLELDFDSVFAAASGRGSRGASPARVHAGLPSRRAPAADSPQSGKRSAAGTDGSGGDARRGGLHSQSPQVAAPASGSRSPRPGD